MKKYICLNCNVKWVLYNLDIWNYSKILNFCSIHLKYHYSHTNKHNIIMATYTELLGTCIKSKTVAYICIQYAPTQINASKNYFTTFGSSACQSHSWHVQLLDIPHKCPRTRYKSLKSLINTNKCQRKGKS